MTADNGDPIAVLLPTFKLQANKFFLKHFLSIFRSCYEWKAYGRFPTPSFSRGRAQRFRSALISKMGMLGINRRINSLMQLYLYALLHNGHTIPSSHEPARLCMPMIPPCTHCPETLLRFAWIF